jgi:hypothetical protein
MIDMYVLLSVVVQVMVFLGLFTVSSQTRCPVNSPLQRVYDFIDYFLVPCVFCGAALCMWLYIHRRRFTVGVFKSSGI